MKKFLRRNLVERLPARWQLCFFRNYYYWGKADYVRREVDLFRNLCDPCRGAVDIGANEGVYAMYLCRFSSRLYCFEPLPWLAERLQKQFDGTQNVRVENCALGGKNEMATIRIPVTKDVQYDSRSSLVGDFDEQSIDGSRVVTVKEVSVNVRRLDDFNLDNIGFIKIDVEGFELEVLKGGGETILRNRPNLYIEIEQKHHKDVIITAVFDAILALGYRGFFRFQNRLLPIEQFVAGQHQSIAGGRAKDDYCGDFIFLPPDASALKKLRS